MRKHDERKQQFKKGMDQEESRRRREATSVQIRKEKKEDSLQKRRAPSRDASSSSGQASSSVGTLPDMTLKAKLENLLEDVAMLQARAAVPLSWRLGLGLGLGLGWPYLVLGGA